MKTDLTPEQVATQLSWKQRIESLIDDAYDDGVIISIALVPNRPLAMGNYTQVVDVRPRRVLATPIDRTGGA